MARKTRVKYPVETGLGNNAREYWSGQRITPNPEQQLLGFYVGQIMDDQDDQRRGRVWVYIPGISVKRFDDQSLPLSGTAPDRTKDVLDTDQRLRLGWLLVSPVSPFFGSDGFRGGGGPSVNSYGMWVQPRIGDFLAIQFAGGDPNRGYYLGMVPKPNPHPMVPGAPGEPAGEVSGNETDDTLLGQVPSNSQVPVMDTEPTEEDPQRNRTMALENLARSQAGAGVSGDQSRGAGTSGSSRESPSFVTGIMSQGWRFDTEKSNFNADGSRFNDRGEKYQRVNTSGHQIVMDDHPDHQSMRFRTSSGSQILMQDAGDQAYIYIQTANGGSWIEISDSGDVSMYAEQGIHFHARDDFNLTVDGDMNVGVKGDYNLSVDGELNQHTEGLAKMSFGGDLLYGVRGEYDFSANADARQNFGGTLDTRIGGTHSTTGSAGARSHYQGSYRLQTTGDMEQQSVGDFLLLSGEGLNLNAGTGINNVSGGSIGFRADTDVSMLVGGNIGVESGGTISVLGGDNINMDGGPDINLNSGGSSSVDSTSIPTRNPGVISFADMAYFPEITSPNITPVAPTAGEIVTNAATQYSTSTAAVVPQHQPWPERSDFGTTGTTAGAVRAQPVDGGMIPRTNNLTVNRDAPNIRSGSGFRDSIFPDFSIDAIGDVLGGLSLPIFSGGSNFTSDAPGEAPERGPMRGAGRLNDVTTLDAMVPSENLLRYLRRTNTFVRRPRLNSDESGYVIGYGSRLRVGDTIGGSTITSANINSQGSELERFTITRDEAEERLKNELDEIRAWAIDTFSGVYMTQQQFDAMLSFVHNVGLDELQGSQRGQDYIQSVRQQDMSSAQNAMYDFVHVGGGIDGNLLNRRRFEVSRFGQPVDFGGITRSNRPAIPSAPSTPTVKLTPEQEIDAIIRVASDTLVEGVPSGYLWALSGLLTDFNRFEQSTLTTGGGLFLITEDVGTEYGISEDRAVDSTQAETPPFNDYEVYDPELNATAAASFTNDNYQALLNTGLKVIASVELYISHIFGEERAVEFFRDVLDNPGDPAELKYAQEAVIYADAFYDGATPRTHLEVYEFLLLEIENYRLAYTGSKEFINDSPSYGGGKVDGTKNVPSLGSGNVLSGLNPAQGGGGNGIPTSSLPSGGAPSGAPLQQYGEFSMTDEVRNAIRVAEETLTDGVPTGFLFAIASFESAFNRYAQNSLSSAGGLFQFIRETGLTYGIDAARAANTDQASTHPYLNYEVYDPEINARAGAAFTNDNYIFMESRGVVNIGATELYAAHFLGAGGAANFFLNYQSNPSGIAANDFPSAASVNRGVFYTNGRPRTYQEVYDFLFGRIEGARQQFTSSFTTSPLQGTIQGGSITWLPGLRQPNFVIQPVGDNDPSLQPNLNTIRAIAEQSAIEAGIDTLVFNSGYRSPSRNVAADGADNSQHLFGRALDIGLGHLSLSERRAFIDRCCANGISGVGRGASFCHIDFRPSARVTWAYGGYNGWMDDILRSYGFIGV